ncbi:protein disabled isoform X2 [Phlebotomus papatasi]|uniref:protein disabled isoform X2 n=1 Tax=Phlebotomus papatasi TaxID=29031 RepID=UPI0024842F70|nr:protein disabled isoform X2 [Phlebotomus papatasi]
MQTLRKKTSPCKYRNDPGRFFGDGVTFKAKLIGILEVGEARGDRMCQEALQDLKMAIRAAGEHKQRITIHVTIDGLRLRDEKTGDSLYHHPVHKISFIAQDMTDSRAFGYIFGSPDSGHRFFGIKTDKAASQVVLAMRDLFQVVFELKKKEIELARQNIQSKTIHEHHPITLSRTLDTSNYSKSHEMASMASKTVSRSELSPESVADLVDLEQELSSIQRGITQMERITPNEVPSKSSVDSEDPFGDSFTKFPHPSYNLLPPPESSRSRHSKPLKPPTEDKGEEKAPAMVQSAPPGGAVPEDWINAGEGDGVFEKSRKESGGSDDRQFEDSLIASTSAGSNLGGADASASSKYADAFTDLDPLGTGKIKPYVDKKYFFQDLKNPPKKVLRELSGPEVGFAATFSGVSGEGEENRTHDSGISDIDLAMFEGMQMPERKEDGSRSVECAKTEEVKEMSDPFAKGHIDPFMDDEDFAKASIDPFDFSFGGEKDRGFSPRNQTTVLPDTKISTDDSSKVEDEARDNVFNGPLQVTLPPEWPSYMGQKKLDRQNSDSPTALSSSAIIRNRPSVFKQNTVDVISSISSKKMMKPHLFGQKFSKRDSNSINMRRLQESDSMSENETAPEPPPRPDSSSHVEPPPLPPKKQFGDIVIRPSTRSSGYGSRGDRYDYVLAKMSKNSTSDTNAPPLPLPSRRIGRSDANYPGPGRPEKKVNDDEDYLTPLSKNDLPILLPPPTKSGTKSRGRKIEVVEIRSSPKMSRAQETPPVLPDITLSQLLTLGIDELATKLNVPVTKLSTMTLVELTTYLSEFLENAKKAPLTAPEEPAPPPPAPAAAIFKVNFDQKNDDQLFVAKFDDDDENFGGQTFVANFEGMDIKAPEPILQTSSVDRYAVFREIIEKEFKEDVNQEDRDDEDKFEDTLERISPIAAVGSSPELGQETIFQAAKINSKITEAIAQAKDRYAALRDIILVEDLFDKAPSSTTILTSQAPEGATNEAKDNEETEDQEVEPRESEEKVKEMSLLDSTTPAMSTSSLTGGTKDDIEIDELMNRAISNLSLDSRDHLSPSKSPVATAQNASTSPIRLQQNTPQPLAKSPTLTPTPQPTESVQDQGHVKTTVTDMSTSPIPIQKSPARSPLSKSPIDNLVMQQGTTSKSPTIPQNQGVSNILESHRQGNSGSLSDVVCGSSPDIDKSEDAQKGKPAPVNSDSWAVFDAPSEEKEAPVRSPRDPSKNGESPCSSDKDDWKGEGDFGRRWPPRGHTSSSSRDVSPWDEDGPADYRRRPPIATDRHGHYMRHGRRMNSCDEDYEYEMEFNKKRDRRSKLPITRSRETFEGGDGGAWYHSGDPHNWSPAEEDDRPRSFERTSYERSTYGPPYEKRERKGGAYPGRGYDKRKYFGSYGRSGGDYEFEGYDDAEAYEMARSGTGKGSRKDYVDVFEAGSAGGAFERSSSRDRIKPREYYYDRKSFDRESGESYDSGCGGRLSQREFSNRDATYGSLEMMRDDYIDRSRYISTEKTRSLRKGIRRSTEDDGYEQDSDGEMGSRRPGDTRSLQRPPQGSGRPRKSSGSSPWDGEDLTPTGQASKGGTVAAWKRPASASESERRLAESRRMLSHATTLSGSDGEKDRRFRKKTRVRGKESDPRVNYASMRYAQARSCGGRSDDYYDFDDVQLPPRGVPEVIEGSYYNMTKQQFFKSTTPRSEGRSMGESLRAQQEMDTRRFKKHLGREAYFEMEHPGGQKFATFDEGALKAAKGHFRREFDFEEYEDTPRSTTSSKFNFDEEQGFESDFNSPSNGKSYRFSNDFSDPKESPRPHAAPNYSFESSASNSTKLRFDEKVQHMFEDDFSKAELSVENEDQWSAELPKKSLKVTTSRNYDHLKKSESVNIFAKKTEDPFEDDDFFKSAENSETKKKDNYKWEKNFANFDDNI